MTNIESAALEVIDGAECRFLMRSDGEPLACTSDMYRHFDIDKSTFNRLFVRHEDEFSKYIVKINGSDLQHVNGNLVASGATGFQKGTIYTFMDESGYNLMIQKIDPQVVGNDASRNTIMARQRGMAEVFTKYRRKEVIDAKTVAPTVHPSMRSPEQVCKDKIDLGNFLADIFGIPKQMAATVSINEAQRETGVDFSNYQKLLPAVDGTYEEPKIGAQDLGKPYGDNGRKVNLLLQKLGYIYKDNGKWQMTQIGKDYGGAWFTFTAPNGHTDTHLRWPTKIKEVIKEHANFFK